MAEFSRRCLFKINNQSPNGDSSMFESVWAYSITYPKAIAPTPGRYRIRVVKLDSDALPMIDDEELENMNYSFSIQAYVERWSDRGWLQCLDWIGDPDSTVEDIEDQLNDMYKSFILGKPIEKTYESSSIPPLPPKRRPKKPKTRTDIRKKTIDEDSSSEDSGEDIDGDTDWI